MGFRHALLAVIAGLTLRGVNAEEAELTPSSHIRCEGMYSRSAWGGPVEPFILTKFNRYVPTGENDPNTDPVVAYVVFDWKDQDQIGIQPDPDSYERILVCDNGAIQGGYCPEEDFGKFIIPKNNTRISTQPIHIASDDRPAQNLAITRTGYYCVDILAVDEGVQFSAITEFRNAYGELPGAQIAKLPFYGGLTIVYAVIGIFWGFLYFQNRSDILAVQNYITATLGFLVVEMLMTWGYYDYLNRHGFNVGGKALMLVVSILNAGRNSLSFFLLLIVCMGYGVVKNTLGKTMTYVRWLAVSHFVFGVIYAIGSLTIKPEDAGPLVLLVVLPLAATGTAFYVWTLNSLGATLKDLYDRKQRIKALMYRRLWWCILSSVVIIFLFFFVNVFLFTGQTGDFAPDHWQTRWFELDGWLNLVYLADVAFIAYLWRPTPNNRRFAMSDEISQDEDGGFEIASIRGSMDMDDEERGGPPSYSATPGNDSHEANGQTDKQNRNRDISPLPAPQPQRPSGSANLRGTRESLDGETIFAVGDDGDRFSDDDGNDEERKGLTGKKD